MYFLVFKDPASGKLEVWFVFQKMKYVYDGEEKKEFKAVMFPIDHSLRYYMEYKGYQEDTDLKHAEHTYGKNL